MRFQLKAVSVDGRVESLDFQALDEAGARQQAEERGYTVLQVRRKSGLFEFWRAGQRFPVALFSQELLVLLERRPAAGGCDRDACRERAPRGFSRPARAPRRDAAPGLPFSAALEQLPTSFSPLYVATVRASRAHQRPRFRRSRATSPTRTSSTQCASALVNASIYPALLVGVGGLVSLFLMLYVVPRFSRIYEERAAELPLVLEVPARVGQAGRGPRLSSCWACSPAW